MEKTGICNSEKMNFILVAAYCVVSGKNHEQIQQKEQRKSNLKAERRKQELQLEKLQEKLKEIKSHNKKLQNRVHEARVFVKKVKKNKSFALGRQESTNSHTEELVSQVRAVADQLTLMNIQFREKLKDTEFLYPGPKALACWHEESVKVTNKLQNFVDDLSSKPREYDRPKYREASINVIIRMLNKAKKLSGVLARLFRETKWDLTGVETESELKEWKKKLYERFRFLECNRDEG